MVEATVELQRDNPEAYIPRDRRRALAAGTTMPDRVRGAGLFADISGFTPLTEALATELGPQRGAEELTAALGRVFHEVIDELDRYGGDVIYFSGDAITCWLDGDDGTRATACGLAMQTAIERVGRIVTPGGNEVVLAMKVAIAVGPARRFVVGVPRVQLIDVLAGHLVDDLAEAEHHAGKGEVVLDPSAIASLGDRVELTEERIDATTGRRFGVVGRLNVDVPVVDVEEPPPLPESIVRQWLLPAVYERMRTGRGEFLAELRAAYPLFLRFGGIDYDDDDEADVKLDAFVIKAQEILDGYGGNVLQLTLGDKGAYLYGVFGSPLAHENDAARAASAALELLDLGSTTAATDIQVGITHGRLRSGTYGHAMRRTFVCLGDAVNLSARLMSAAPPGAIYVSRTVHEDAGDVFRWEHLADLTVKGKSEPVEVFALTGALTRTSRRQTRYELPLVGRRAELARLDHGLDLASAGHGQVVAVAAEAGMGKSRLVAEFVRNARRAGHQVAFGECQAFGTTTSYLAWREIWRTLLHVEDSAEPERQRAAIEATLNDLDPALVPRAPLLGSVVGVAIADNDLTAGFDPKLRKASLEDLLARCLAGLATRPIVLVLEDCHWIDELSRDLLETLVRATAGLPVCFVPAYRPAAEPGGGLGLERLAQFEEVVLDQFDADETRQIIRSKLTQLIGGDRVAPEPLVDLITTRADGNPFYVEELLNYLVTQGIDPADPSALTDLELPNSLQSLILGRIDQLDEGPRRTIKVASVLGRTFEAPVLPRVYPEIGPLDDVTRQLDQLRQLDLIALDREAEQAYLFRHVLTQTVAYESMPFALRSTLHRRVGEDLETAGKATVGRSLDLLGLPLLAQRRRSQEAVVPRRRGRRRTSRVREHGRHRLLRAPRPTPRRTRSDRRPAQPRQGARAHRGVAARRGCRQRRPGTRRRDRRRRRGGLGPCRAGRPRAEAGAIRLGDGAPRRRDAPVRSRRRRSGSRAGPPRRGHGRGADGPLRRCAGPVRTQPRDPAAPRRSREGRRAVFEPRDHRGIRGCAGRGATPERAGARDADRGRRPMGHRCHADEPGRPRAPTRSARGGSSVGRRGPATDDRGRGCVVRGHDSRARRERGP